MSYIPTTIKKTKTAMIRAKKKQWEAPFFDFVDDFRYCRNLSLLLPEPFELGSPRLDAILASTVEYLCGELKLTTPDWSWEVLGLAEPWFVAEIEDLKAFAIVESPVFFRRRNIFVLGNFLSRV